MSQLNWNQSEVDTSGGYAEIPDGWHEFLITRCDVLTSKNTGEDQVEMDATVMSRQANGQSKRFWISIYSDNEQVRDIAQQLLARIAEACGITDLKDTTELENKSFKGKLVTKKSKGKDYQNMYEVMPVESAAPADNVDTSIPEQFR